MLTRFQAFVLMSILFCVPGASAGECPAEYSAEQCEQMMEDDGDSNGGGTCSYNMCGNATFENQSSWGWCEATQSWVDCPIFFCKYVPCIGRNCTPTWIVCSGCSSREGNNVQSSSCPRN